MNKRLVWNFEINSDRPLQVQSIQSPEVSANMRWETRFFWPSDAIITLYSLEDANLELSRYEITHRHDTYCILPGHDINLKTRREQLLYKPLLATTPHARAFGKKLPLSEQTSSIPLPGTALDLPALLTLIEQKGQLITVDKEALIYRFETIPKSKLELAKLRIANTTYFSASIESRALALVESIAHQLLPTQVSCDYVSFLRKKVS